MKLQTDPLESRITVLRLYGKRMYDAQKLRVSNDHRFRELESGGHIPDAKTERLLAEAMKSECEAERSYAKILAHLLKGIPIWDQWLCNIKGVGPRLGASFIGLTHRPAGEYRVPRSKKLMYLPRLALSDRDTAGQLWAYAGLTVTAEGKARKRAAGEHGNWSWDLRQTCWKFATQIKKTKCRYNELCAGYKERLIRRMVNQQGRAIYGYDTATKKWRLVHGTGEATSATTPEWTLGHVDNMAMRWIAKLFLSHLWEVACELDGKKPAKPFAFGVLQHDQAHYISPWSMVEKDVARKKRKTA